MKALLLAAGLGTRLKPFTFFRAKASLPLLDVPFIHYPLQYLHANGVSEVVINLHAHPDSVRQAAGSEYRGMKIHYSHEPEILGTAGAMWKARDLLDGEPFAVVNGDMLLDIPLQQMLAQHAASGSLVTLAVMDGARFPDYSGLSFRQGDPPVWTGLSGPGDKLHYTGVQVVSPEVIGAIPPETKSEIFKEVYPQLCSSGRIHGFRYDGLWLEIGTLKQYLQTSIALLSSQLPQHLCPGGIRQSLVSGNARVEDGAVVENSIVMEGAVVRAGASVKNCIVGWEMDVAGKWENAALAHGILPWWIQA